MNKLTILLFAMAVTIFMWANSSHACTDFRLTAKDGTILITRSMEFATDMQSNLRSSNHGRQVTALSPDGKPSLSWKVKYGYLSLDGLGQDIALDGINETGLTFEYLYLPGETQYQAVPADKFAQALPYYLLGDWILGNFKTVDEVKQALPNVFVYAGTFPSLGDIIFQAHAAVYDASGKGIVIEFVNGKVNVYDSIGIMTNSPTYTWQVTNLRNYLNLSPYNPKPLTVNGLTYTSTGQGSGMVGLPGDVSPPSRFAKIAFMATAIYPAESLSDLLNQAEHLINNVDIPAGLARSLDNGKESSDITQWVVFKDITHKVLYYRTYNNMTLRAVSMSKVDFSDKAVRLKMPLAGNPTVIDMTAQFNGAH